MKFIITPIFFFFIHNCFSQQLLVKIAMENKSKIGYGVEMFYVFDNADEFKSNISNISKFTEREILNAFNLPLVEPGLSAGNCEPFDKLLKKNSDFIQKPKNIVLAKTEWDVSISVSFVFVEYCVFDLPVRYWSYDVHFKKAAVITAYRRHRKKISQTTLNDIENLFNKLPD